MALVMFLLERAPPAARTGAARRDRLQRLGLLPALGSTSPSGPRSTGPSSGSASSAASCCSASSARRRVRTLALTAITGAAAGWVVGAWGGGNVGRGNLTGVLLATVVPAVLIGLRIGLATLPTPAQRRRIEARGGSGSSCSRRCSSSSSGWSPP